MLLNATYPELADAIITYFLLLGSLSIAADLSNVVVAMVVDRCSLKSEGVL